MTITEVWQLSYLFLISIFQILSSKYKYITAIGRCHEINLRGKSELLVSCVNIFQVQDKHDHLSSYILSA